MSHSNSSSDTEQDLGLLCAPLISSVNHQADLLKALQQDKFDSFRQALSSQSIDVNKLYDFPVCTSCVHLAAKRGKAHFLKLLLEAGADPNLWSSVKKNTPLMVAVEDINIEAVSLLLEYGARVDIKDVRGRSVLHLLVAHSARAGSAEVQALAIAKELLRRVECDIDCQDISQQTALRIAVETKQDNLTRLLISNGARTDLPGAKGACAPSIDSILQQRGLKPDHSLKVLEERNRNLPNLLYETLVARNLPSFITVLDRVKFDSAALDCVHGQHTCLTYACLNGLYDYVDALLSAGANPIACHPSNCITPLHFAAKRGFFLIFKRLIDIAPNCVNDEDAHQQTVLHRLAGAHMLVKEENADHFGCLLLLSQRRNEFGLDINHQDSIGCTPLHYAVHYGTIKITKLLLGMGGNMAIKNNFGAAPVSDISHDVLSEFLDECIVPNDADIYDKNFKIELKYDFLAPKKSIIRNNYGATLTETETLWYIVNSKQQMSLIKHPVLASFISLKWQKIKSLIYINLLFYILFTIILFAHIFFNVLENGMLERNEINMTNSNTSHDRATSQTTLNLQLDSQLTTQLSTFILKLIHLLAIASVAALFLRELCQFLIAPRRYLFTVENIFEIMLICMSSVLFFQELSSKTRLALSSFLILLTLAELFLLLGRLPAFSIYVKLFSTVTKRFLSIFLWYFVLLAAFATSMHVLFRQHEAFASFGSSFIKVLVMTIGEMDYGALPLQDNFPSGSLIFVLFLFLITVVLMNLLNGLAVSDTGEIQEKARLYCLIGFVDLVCYFESMMLGDPFQLLSNYPPFKWLRVVPDCFLFRFLLSKKCFSFVKRWFIARTLLFLHALPHKSVGFYPNVGSKLEIGTNEKFTLDVEILQDARNIVIKQRNRSVDLGEKLRAVETKLDHLMYLIRQNVSKHENVALANEKTQTKLTYEGAATHVF